MLSYTGMGESAAANLFEATSGVSLWTLVYLFLDPFNLPATLVQRTPTTHLHPPPPTHSHTLTPQPQLTHTHTQTHPLLSIVDHVTITPSTYTEAQK
jgi:hypothetical protein